MVVGNRGVTLKRRLAIADLVRKEGEIRVEDLSGRLKVSAVTIRGDLTYLEHEGLLARRFGKAIAQSPDYRLVPEGSATSDRVKFRGLLLAAADILSGEQTILAGRGPLPLQLIPYLGDIPDLSLTVSSLDAVVVARTCIDCEIHILGGRLDQDGSTMTGSKAIQRLRHEMLGAYVFESEAIELSANGARPPCLVFGSHHEASFAATACEHATRAVAMVRSTTARAEAGSSTLKLDAVHDLVLPEAPSAVSVDCLTRLGYAPRPSALYSAAIFTRAPLGGLND